MAEPVCVRRLTDHEGQKLDQIVRVWISCSACGRTAMEREPVAEEVHRARSGQGRQSLSANRA